MFLCLRRYVASVNKALPIIFLVYICRISWVCLLIVFMNIHEQYMYSRHNRLSALSSLAASYFNLLHCASS